MCQSIFCFIACITQLLETDYWIRVIINQETPKYYSVQAEVKQLVTFPYSTNCCLKYATAILKHIFESVFSMYVRTNQGDFHHRLLSLIIGLT